MRSEGSILRSAVANNLKMKYESRFVGNEPSDFKEVYKAFCGCNLEA